jgi:hypothetical protein
VKLQGLKPAIEKSASSGLKSRPLISKFYWAFAKLGHRPSVESDEIRPHRENGHQDGADIPVAIFWKANRSFLDR